MIWRVTSESSVYKSKTQEHLVEEPVRKISNSHLQSFTLILREVGDLESEWVVFQTSIAEVADWRLLVPALEAVLKLQFYLFI